MGPIIRTKLHRPRLSGDLVHRPALQARLEEGFRGPLTLVSAPAGYGKGTLISQWLDRREGPSAWLSLEEADDDLRSFLAYFVAAVRTVFPEACPNAAVLSNAPELPSTRIVAATLGNDLDAIEERLILVFNDFHRIRSLEIHELVDLLLEQAPRSLHLAIISRRDPPLSLHLLRARNQVNEFRMRDLQFTREETVAFLSGAVEQSLDGGILECFQEATEGWPVSLRLLALALRRGGDAGEVIRGYDRHTRHIAEYLTEEVLSGETPAIRDALAKLSIVDRFCAPLATDLCGLDEKDFAKLRMEAGMLCIPLDEHGEWHRFHHLFQQLLQRRLADGGAQDDVAALHRRAGVWFAENGLIEEALRHAMQGDDVAAASKLVAEHGNSAMNQEQWNRLDRWLALLGPEVVERDPRLVIFRAFLRDYRYEYAEVWEDLRLAEPLVAALSETSAVGQRVRGEFETLRGNKYYLESDHDRALAAATRAIELLPDDDQSARGHAYAILAAAHQMGGDVDRAYNCLYDAMKKAPRDQTMFRGRLLSTLCWIHWMAGDLTGLRQTACRLLELGRKFDLVESTDFATYFLGVAHYHLNELVDAEQQLASIAARPFVSRGELYSHGSFALALVHLARGRLDEAERLVESVTTNLLEAENAAVLLVARAFRAELAIRQGRLAEAWQWAERFDPEPLLPLYMFYVPQLTLAKVLIAHGEPESLRRAEKLLARLHDYVSRTHNRRFLIDALALQALLRHAQHDDSAAATVLEEAVLLGQAGGFTRVFADVGSGVANLLHRLELDEAGVHYVGEALAAFRSEDRATGSAKFRSGAAATPGRQPGIDPLSKREGEILALLADRLTNPEISERLHISTVTVKRHVANIFQKLGVHDRRAAVSKALGLGLLGG